MSKYKVGDKIILTVTGMTEMGTGYSFYMLNDSFNLWEQSIDDYAEPLSTYTEPLERKNENKQKQIEKLVDKLHRQAAEITRLLAENKELKEDKAVLNAKIDAYKLYADQHEEEYNQAFNQGAEAAWELARKINDMDIYDTEEIFIEAGAFHLGNVLENYTYSEAAAKVAEWENAKEEIEVGDALEYIYDSNVKCVVTNMYPGNMAYLVFDDGTAGMHELNSFKKTGRHIDIDSFLNQIRGEEE